MINPFQDNYSLLFWDNYFTFVDEEFLYEK